MSDWGPILFNILYIIFPLAFFLWILIPRENFEMYSLTNAISRVFEDEIIPFFYSFLQVKLIIFT